MSSAEVSQIPHLFDARHEYQHRCQPKYPRRRQGRGMENMSAQAPIAALASGIKAWSIM